MEERINFVYMPMGGRIKGFVVRDFDENGEEVYTIFINTNKSSEVQFETFRHEIAHIVGRDFDRCKEMDTTILEAYRHRQFA